MRRNGPAARRAPRASLAPEPDDSHTNLGWDGSLSALVSQDIPVAGGNARFGLRLPDLTLLCAGADGGIRAFPLDGQTNEQAGAWVADKLAALGLEAPGLSEDLHYELPASDAGEGAAYGATAEAGGLPELAIWFDLADAALSGIVEAYRELDPGPSAVRCWPHHFDIATLIGLDAGGGETARSIGVGMTPGDGGYAQPYFYVTPWPYHEVAKLVALEEPAFWHTEGWIGAVIKGTSVIEITDSAGQEAMVRVAMRHAVDRCLSILGG